MFNTIIVAVDGSDHSDAALRVACDISRKYASKLILVHTPEPMTDPMMAGYAVVPSRPIKEAIEEAAKDVMDKAAAVMKKEGMSDYATEIVTGDPATQIVKQAEEKGADLIVLGRRGLGAVSRLLVGSTTTKVAQLADCAVLTVK